MYRSGPWAGAGGGPMSGEAELNNHWRRLTHCHNIRIRLTRSFTRRTDVVMPHVTVQLLSLNDGFTYWLAVDVVIVFKTFLTSWHIVNYRHYTRLAQFSTSTTTRYTFPVFFTKTHTKPGLLTLLYIYAVSFRYLDLTFARGSIYVTILRCLEIYIWRTAVSVN